MTPHIFQYDQVKADQINAADAVRLLAALRNEGEHIFLQTFADPDDDEAQNLYEIENRTAKSGRSSTVRRWRMAGVPNSSGKTRMVSEVAEQWGPFTLNQLSETPYKWTNLARAGVFFCVNVLVDGAERRKTEYVARVAAVWLDLDGAPLPEKFPIEPTAIVESSAGKYHVYWAVKDVALAEFRTFQQILARLYGGDTQVCDLPRVMRLPGYFHSKRDPAQLVKLVTLHEEAQYARADLLTAWPELANALESARQQRERDLEKAVRRRVEAEQLRQQISSGQAGTRAEVQRKYGLIALHELCADLEEATEGQRNFTMNAVSYRAGRFVGAGILTEAEAVTAITYAAERIGLPEAEIKRTVGRSVQDGMKEPFKAENIGQFLNAGVNAEGWASGASPLKDAPSDSFNSAIQGVLTPSKELEWGEWQELPPSLPPVPTMPPEMLPEVLRPWLVDVAELACVPLEGLAAPAVAGLSGLIGRSVQLKPEVHSDWVAVPNLWSADILRPSALKSMQLTAALEPLRELEKRARAEFEEAELEREIRLENLKAQEDVLRKAARTKSGSLDTEALRELRIEARQAEAKPRRYLVQDMTYQKAGELLNENPVGLTMYRDELSGWRVSMNDEQNAEARGFFLSAWNGNTSYDFERVGRGTVRVDNACLAVVGAIQPGPLHHFVMRSRAGSEGDVGLLQRFQLLIYPDSLGEWKRPRRAADGDAKARAFKVYEVLDTLRQADEPTTLRFGDEAQPVFEEWRDALEHRLRGGGLAASPAFESHLGKYRSLVPSLALIFHLVQEAAAGRVKVLSPVTVDALELALNWAEYLELHARKVYALDLGLSNSPAHALAGKIKEGTVKDGDRLRDLRRKDWTGLKGELLGLAVEQLAVLGWVHVEEVDTGGRPSQVLRLHPGLNKGEA